MADFIAAANGVASGSIWGTVDTTSFLDSEAASTVLTTSYVESAASAPGAIEIDGIAVKVARRATTASGTLSVRLAQAGALVTGTEVTIDVADIPYGNGVSADASHHGWIFFKFAAPVTLLAATNYTISAKASVASQVSLYRNGTAGNWSRMLRTTTLDTIGAGDNWHVLGEWTAASTVTTRTVTWDGTATTDYGGASTTIPGLTVGNGGTLTWQTLAATAYILRFSGIFRVCMGGVHSMGTVGVPCPADSSMELQIDAITNDGDSGYQCFGTHNGQAPERLAGVTNHFALLNTDEAAAQTTLGVDRQLSAKSGDTIAIASTSRTSSEAETVVLSGDAGASTLSCGAIANAHLGTAPTQAEVIGLNRHVRIVSTSSTLMGYVFFANTATVDLDWVEFRYLGHVSTTGKRGVEVQTSTEGGGSFSASKCSFRDFDNHGVYIARFSTENIDNVSVVDCVFSKVGHQSTSHAAIRVDTTTTGTWTITGNVVIADNTQQGAGIYLNSNSGNCSNNRLTSGGGSGINMVSEEFISGTISGNVMHSNGLAGLLITSKLFGGVIADTESWRNSNEGIRCTGGLVSDLLFDGLLAFGNTSQNVFFSSTHLFNVTFRDAILAGDSTFATTHGVSLTASFPINLRFEGCSFGVASGIYVAHTNDLILSSTTEYGEVTFVDTILASATEINGSANLHGRSFFRYQSVDGVSGTNTKNYVNIGTTSRDTVTFRTASPSQKLEPTAAANAGRVKLESQVKRVPVRSGQSCTITVYVNKGASYDGSAPRLRVKGNSAAGIDEATVATHGSGTGAFVSLSGTVGPVSETCVLEFIVDCDGTAGQINVDDWSYTVA